jgi:MoaA/NifB/PqqE/SkfB family radical SAM enzyme
LAEPHYCTFRAQVVLRPVRQQLRPCPHGYACRASFDPLGHVPFHRHLELLAAGLGGPTALAAGTAFVVTPRHSPLAVGDGRGVVFISRCGDVCPSGFSPLVVGNVRQTLLSAIYAGSPLLGVLRDPRRLSGRCGRGELAEACGGSRAQANARSSGPPGA